MNRFSVLTEVPSATKGLVRELRVRWFHEEIGLPYEEIRCPHRETKQEEYLKHQPFGQVPYFVSGEFEMFESGAILLHLAMKHNQLLPSNEADRAQVFQWMFAAQTSIEPFFFHCFMLSYDPDATENTKKRARDLFMGRLRALSKVLGDKQYFGKDFSIAEMMMTTVLSSARSMGFTSEFPNLINYLEKNEAREAFQRALQDHLKLYK